MKENFKKCHKFAKFEDIGCAGIKKIDNYEKMKMNIFIQKKF